MFVNTKEQNDIEQFVEVDTRNLLIEALAGCGKCLGINTPILMYDGSIKLVQDINNGDKIMGDDSKPKTVLSTNIGHGDLYKIIPQKGENWVCNDIHVMTVHCDYKNKIYDIPLNEIKNKKYPNGNYRYYRIVRGGVNFINKKTNIDPYLLGLWLGDGSKDNGSPIIHVHESEKPILNYLNNIKYKNITPKFKPDSRKNGLIRISLTTKNNVGGFGRNMLREEFKKCIHNKKISIPKKYLINSKNVRLKLLAGLIDSDGHNHGKTYDYITKYETLKNDILYLCRSLGFAAYAKETIKGIKKNGFKGKYWRINISGSFENVPCLLERKKCEKRKQIKSVLRTGFKKEYIGKGDYYGFTLNGNGRFFLGDFTITHNTSTLINLIKLLPQDKSITFLAFNKHIQMELKEKLPSTVYCYTSHGLGRGGIMRKYKDAELDEFKMDKIISAKAKKWDLSDFKYEEELDEYLKGIKKLSSLCKTTLTTQKKKIPDLAEKYDITLYDDRDVNRVLSILDASIKDKKTYDFDDMVFLPAIDPKIWLFPQDYVLLDEAQDINRAQQAIIQKIIKKDKKGNYIGRAFFVGDKNQAIYGFSGSDAYSFEWFKNFPNTVTFPLTTTFRCSKEVVIEANKIVPDLKAMPTAKKGCVREGDVVKEARSGDFVLCRKTLPLVKLFFQFLSEHRKVTIKGSDIGISLIEMVKRKRNIEVLTSNLKKDLKDFAIKLKSSGVLDVKEHSGYTALEDKIMVLLFIAEMSKDMYELKSKIRKIFTDKIEGIVLSTVHKIKGLEADRVFIIRPDILPMQVKKPWEYQQEKNLEYVAITRARLELIYDYDWNDEKISLSDIKQNLL